MSTYSDSGLVKSVVVSGGKLPESVVASLFAASLDLSTSQLSQLSLSVIDPDLALVTAGYLHKGTRIEYGNLAFIVTVRGIQPQGGVPALSIVARSATAMALKGRTGALARSNLSPTQFLAAECAAINRAGTPTRFVGQPSAVRPQIVRAPAEPGQVTPPSTWDLAATMAGQLGFIAFDVPGCFYFGSPSWLVSVLPRVAMTWRGLSVSPGVWDVPTFRDSDNSLDKTVTGSVSVDPGWADTMTPGTSLAWTIAGYGGVYMVTDLSFSLDGVSPATVSFATPINPAVTG